MAVVETVVVRDEVIVDETVDVPLEVAEVVCVVLGVVSPQGV